MYLETSCQLLVAASHKYLCLKDSARQYILYADLVLYKIQNINYS